jgi:hypothetical protein
MRGKMRLSLEDEVSCSILGRGVYGWGYEGGLCSHYFAVDAIMPRNKVSFLIRLYSNFVRMNCTTADGFVA